MIEEFWTNFTKKQIQRIENESLRTRLNKSISQGDADNYLSVKNEFNYDYARTNNKGIILIHESLRIDTTSKIESLMIKLKSIDTNENKKIKFSRMMMAHTSLCCRRQTGIQRQNTSHAPVQKQYRYHKVFPNSIKSLGYLGGRRKLLLQYTEHCP